MDSSPFYGKYGGGLVMEMKYANDEWKVRDMESSQFYDNDAEREVSELPYIADHDE